MRAHDAVSNHPRSVSRHTGWFVVAVLALLGSGGCSEATTELPQPQGPVSVVIAPADLSLSIGEVATLTAEALDAKRQRINATFVWSSAFPAVATVSSVGVVTAVGAGSTTVSARTGAATGAVTVTVTGPPVAISISPVDMAIALGSSDRLTARAVNALGRTVNVPFEWTSANPAIATVGRNDGVLTGIALGSTTVTAAVGAVRATVSVTVEAANYLAQWAYDASASTQYTNSEWSAAQATGMPNVFECADDPLAWASADTNLDWLEVTYAQPVRPTKIHIYEVWAVGLIVKVEVKDELGSYHAVYSAAPTGSDRCPRVLAIDVTNVTLKVAAVRITVDQRTKRDWAEIDAVRLSGYR